LAGGVLLFVAPADVDAGVLEPTMIAAVAGGLAGALFVILVIAILALRGQLRVERERASSLKDDADRLQTTLDRYKNADDAVLEGLITAIAIYGPDRHLRFANSAFAKLWGLDRVWLAASPTLSEVLEAKRENRKLPELADFPEFKRGQNALFQTLAEPVDYLLHLPDERTLRKVISPHPLGGLIYAFDDVTDSLAMERSYNTLIDVQRETLNHLNEGVAVFGTDGRLKLWNPAFLTIWQIPQAMLDNTLTLNAFLDHCRQFFHDVPDWEAEKRRIRGELQRNQPRWSADARSDGTHIQSITVPLSDGANLFTYFDVTDRERVERALRERNQALEAADHMKTEFVANVSYELRTPINSIMGFTELLANPYFGDLTQRQLEYVQGILEASERLLALINDILDLATIEAGYMVLNLSEIDLHALLSGVVGLIRERARAQQLTVAFDCDPAIGEIHADQRRLRQIVLNLLSNSCNFTPPGGRVTLSAHREGSDFVISVGDTGVGIPERDHGRVLERFERGDKTSKQSGVGLGLSLVRSFVDLHGGRLDISSAPGRGTVVTCRLPQHLTVETVNFHQPAK
jgi:signal transduction histidine kinase